MSYFEDYSGTKMDTVHEKDVKELETDYYNNVFAVSPQVGESGQVIPNLFNNTLKVDDFFFYGLYSSHTPEKRHLGSYFASKEVPTSQQELENFSSAPKEDAESIGFTELETSSRIHLNDAINMSSFNSTVEHQVVDQLSGIYPRELDYQQMSGSLRTPPFRNSQYYTYSDKTAFSLTPPDYSDQPLSWWGHDSSERATPQYSPFLAISEGTMEEKETKNSSDRFSLKTKLSRESINNNKNIISIQNTKSKQLRHYSSVADISSAYQRRKQLNRHKIGQYRSISPCLQIRKRRSTKGLKATESCVGNGIANCFVNYTPEDSEKILTGVAPSGSNKTKARREREALEKRQKLSQAVLKAVEAVGGDTSGLFEEEFFVPI
ncbi:hypothetical protein EPUL_001053 [Erysiphe pulchra]|uniref:Uncharacterized protein n=1 Tax=Erysiphe pulchra TaxID=225359 RepID=A0A2S4PXY3_9PEZI|nr:hypothetical protein EPUL_001053 [Erysiphe pulchra]